MTDTDPRVAAVQERFDRGEIQPPAQLRVVRVECEGYVDSEDQSGVRVWLLLGETADEASVQQTVFDDLEWAIESAARAEGLEGVSILELAFHDEADALPSRRLDAAA